MNIENTIKLTPEIEEFIRANRLEMSIKGLARETKLSYTTIRNYMVKNDLMLTKEELKDLRVRGLMRSPAMSEGYDPETDWVPDPWNHGLNRITMLPTPK